MIKDVAEFNKKFDLPDGTVDLIGLNANSMSEILQYRIAFLKEELDETIIAAKDHDKVKFIDGLLDLCYVAIGTAYFAGVSPEQLQRCWDIIHTTNMSKIRATSSGDSNRGSPWDLVKPEGFIPPDIFIREVLDETKIDNS